MLHLEFEPDMLASYVVTYMIDNMMCTQNVQIMTCYPSSDQNSLKRTTIFDGHVIHALYVNNFWLTFVANIQIS